MKSTVFSGLLAIICFFGIGLGSAAGAASCGGVYTVKAGDSLTGIAERYYGAAGMWTAIHSANVAAIGEQPGALRAGMTLTLRCIDGLPTGLPGRSDGSGAAATVAVSATPPMLAGINLLTAGDNAPYTSQNMPNGGMLTEVVDALMAEAAPEQGYAIRWVEDRASHLDPLLSNALLDLGFPWAKPDCAAEPGRNLCADFHFSDPMFESLILLFTDRGAPLSYTKDADLEGRRLCRPKGHPIDDLDRADRRWLSEGKITLKQPQTIRGCFDLLLAGKVDGVAVDEFVGRSAIRTLNIAGRIDIVQNRPVAIQSQHVLVFKGHPRADALLATVNSGLRAIRENGTYQSILDRHLTHIWAGI